MISYLAAPYSHDSPSVMEERFNKVTEYAAELMRAGDHVFSPITHSHPIAMAGGLPTDWHYWESYDRAFLGICGQLIVYMLDGWEESKGVQAEIRLAKTLGIKIVYVYQKESAA